MKLTMVLRQGISAALLLSLGMLPSTQANAERIYKWVDDQGTTHYGARPPMGRPNQEIRISSPQSTQPESKTESENKSPDSTPKEEPKPEDDIAQRNKEAIAHNCDVYRQNLKVMNESSRVRVQEKDGQMRMLPEEERQEKIRQAQEYLQKHCQ